MKREHLLLELYVHYIIEIISYGLEFKGGLQAPIFENLQANSRKISLQCNDFPDFQKSATCLQILARFLLGFSRNFVSADEIAVCKYS